MWERIADCRMVSILAAAAVLMLMAGACRSNPAPTSTPTGDTFGQMASAGSAVFSSYCSGCHGVSGQGGIGPRLVGAGHDLDDYSTAQGLLGFVRQNMPQNAPGSLTDQQYLDVLAFVLVGNSFVSSDTVFDQAGLRGILLGGFDD